METTRDKYDYPDGYKTGGYAVLTTKDGRGTVRTITKVARDGRVQIGRDWYTPGVPDKWGRYVRRLTKEEEQAHTLLLRQEEALRTLSSCTLHEKIVELLEYLAYSESET